MAGFEITQLHADFGAKITGVDMAAPRSAELIADLHRAIDRYSFLWFPDQSFTDDLQLALTGDLGEPEPGHLPLGEEGKIEYFGTIGNVQPDGSTLGNDATRTKFLNGNNMWHSDSSFRDVPSFVSILCAYETPAEGGETLFVSTRAAYARMGPVQRAEVEPLVGIHDYTYSRSKVAEVAPSLSASLPPVRQRLVRRNPGTGEAGLFIGSHLREIEGWGYERSRPFLQGLIEDATAEPHIYPHCWQPGDLVIWDNRCLLHRGAGYDADRYRRYMRQTRVKGAGPTLEEAA